MRLLWAAMFPGIAVYLDFQDQIAPNPEWWEKAFEQSPVVVLAVLAVGAFLALATAGKIRFPQEVAAFQEIIKILRETIDKLTPSIVDLATLLKDTSAQATTDRIESKRFFSEAVDRHDRQFSELQRRIDLLDAKLDRIGGNRAN